MIDKQQIIDRIFHAIDEVNMQLPKEERLGKSADTILFGNSGKLDSLGLVNLIVGLEQKIEETFGCSISLYQSLGAQEVEPFETVGALGEHIAGLLEEEMVAQD